MAAYNKLPSGYWRVQVRRKRQYASRTFRLKSDAEQWALEAERNIGTGKTPDAPQIDRRTTFGHLIELHTTDMAEVGKAPLRSKAKSLEKLQASLGTVALGDLTRERLIEFGKARAREGAGPVTLGIDIGYIRTVLVHAAAIHGITVPSEQVTLARVALRRLGLIGKGNERDRRPTQDELDRIICYHDNNPLQTIPVGRLVKFAIATAMRQEEICRLRWPDIDLKARLAIVCDRKDPRRKGGNDQRVPSSRRDRLRSNRDTPRTTPGHAFDRPDISLQQQVTRDRLPQGLPGARHRRSALPRPAPRGDEPPV